MYRKYYLVEVVILLLLSHGGWNGPSVTLLSCTSESSKLVRDVVQQRFLSVVERYRVSLPLECPLHPRRDMFWWLQTELETTKIEGQETWHCPVCGQKFRCENTFATHWDTLHSRTLGMTEDTICLDDYCDVFRCDVLKKRYLKQRLLDDEHELRHKNLLTTTATNLFTLSVFKPSTNKDASHEEDDEIREKKKVCKTEEMAKRHSKCRSLVRQCTIGMLANLSSKDFQDIEEDLDESICSFLTCDKYWDAFDSPVHRVPLIVTAIFGLIIVSVFCFCYYAIWIIMEKNLTSSNQICCHCRKSQSAERRIHQKSRQNRHRQHSPELQHRVQSRATNRTTPYQEK